MLKQRKFQNLSCSEDTQLKFFNSFRKMNHYIGCYYMGYILEDIESLGRVGFSTNMEWGKEYLANYISHCHLWNQVQKFHEGSRSTSLILYIDPDGISFCKKIGDFREYYYFAPELKERNFLEYVSNNINIIKSEINVFRKDSLTIINRYNNTRAMLNG